MTVGLVARGENRGLGILTWEVARHVQPDRVLLVDMGELSRGFASYPERFAQPTCVSFVDGLLDMRAVDDWLDGLDVVYSAETWYDQRLPGAATLRGVRTVLHAMPEFLGPHVPRPDELWLPTPWLADRLGAHTLVPVPVALDRFPLPWPQPRVDGPLRVLHVAGHKAAADRNGTTTFLRALSLTRAHVHATIVDQDGRRWHERPLGRRVTLDVRGPADDYWNMYVEQDVLVMPRRYGGLSLPVQEAMAAGLAVVMTDVPPNDWWPTMRVRTNVNGRLGAPVGDLRIAQAHPPSLARALDRLDDDRELLAEQQRLSRNWALAHSWSNLLPEWRRLLG